MKTEPREIQEALQQILMGHVPPLRLKVNKETQFEVSGAKEVMQGKQMVDGFFFASLVPKPKDVRLYYFPIYTHAKEFEHISPELRKSLKGKSCFHIKKLSPELEKEIKQMVEKGVELYKKDDLI